MNGFDNGNSSGMNSEDIRKAIDDIDRKLAQLNEKLADCASVPTVHTQDTLSSSSLKKMLFSSALIFVAMIFMVFSSFAYFTASKVSSSNKIASGTVDIDFVDLNSAPSGGGSAGTELDPIRFMPGFKSEKKVYAVNKGGISIYLRAKIETEISLDERYASHFGEIDTSLIIFDIDENFWVEKDGYYYYSAPLLEDQTSPELFSEIVFSPSMGNIYKDSTVRVKVVFEMVQANGNGTNVFEAVGWPTDTEGGTT